MPTARARCSRRALSPFETAFEPAFEPPIATSSEASSEREALRSCAVSRVGIPAVQRLRGAHLDAGRGRCLWRHRGRGLGFRGLARGVFGRLAVALRHQLLDLRPRPVDLLPAQSTHLSRGSRGPWSFRPWTAPPATYQTLSSICCSLDGSRHRFWRIGSSLNVGSQTGPSGSARKAGAQDTETRNARLTARLSQVVEPTDTGLGRVDQPGHAGLPARHDA